MGLSLALLNLYLVTLATAQDTCRVPSFPPLNSTVERGFSAIRQYIIPTMNFTECGVITDWAIVAVGRGRTSADRTIELQLFRPNPTRSTVFTKVTSSVVITANGRNITSTHTFTSIGFTFSPGDVLGFYYPNTQDFLPVRYTASLSTHSVLTFASSPTTNVFTLISDRTEIPLMSVSVNCKECSGRWRNGEVAGAAAGGALAVLLIVIANVLVAIISVVICVRRKNVKSVLDAKSNSASHEPATFTKPNEGKRKVIYDCSTGVTVVSGEDEIATRGVEMTSNPAYGTVTCMSTSDMVKESDYGLPEFNEEGIYDYVS